jgi:hypothetical protein
MKNKEIKVEEPKNEALHIADVKCSAIWKDDLGKYVSSKGLYIGKIKVAGYYYDRMRAKGDPLTYKVTSPIATIKSDLGNYATTEECKALCEKVARLFCEQLGHCT